jgi:hypothetical protein
MSGSIKKSVGKSKAVHGVTVRRLPIGAYLCAIESMGDLPEIFLSKLFPELSLEEAFLKLKHLRTDTLLHVIGRGAAVLPNEFLGFFSILLDVPVEVLRDKLTPDEFMEVLLEFLKINNISNFIQLAKGVVKTLM